MASASSSSAAHEAWAAATARPPNASGARTASCVPCRCPPVSFPTSPAGTSVSGPHMREMVEPRWSRSGSIAMPPTAATHPSWATVPLTGCDRERGGPDREAGEGVGVTEHVPMVTTGC